MDKVSKKILNAIIIYEPDSSYLNYNDFCETYRVDIEPLSFPVIKACLAYLKGEGYIDDVYINGQSTGFTLTHKGRNYKAFKWIAAKQFIFNSILVPIGVSLVTTLITLLITLCVIPTFFP